METEDNFSHSIASKNIFYTPYDDQLRFSYYLNYFLVLHPTLSNNSAIIDCLFEFSWRCIFLRCLCLVNLRIMY